MRSLLVAVSGLAWQATGEHPVLDALNKLRTQYAAGTKTLPAEVTAARLRAVIDSNSASAFERRFALSVPMRVLIESAALVGCIYANLKTASLLGLALRAKS